jgi:hypothetical protein
MATFAYELLRDGYVVGHGLDSTGHASADECARALAEASRPRPVDEVWVWPGRERVGEPAARVRHRARRRVLAAS